jgi:lipopolysaccharide export system permease protein
MGKFISIWVFGTLIVWGIFFLLYKFTNGGILIPEISILLPMVLWLVISISIYNRKINSN